MSINFVAVVLINLDTNYPSQEVRASVTERFGDSVDHGHERTYVSGQPGFSEATDLYKDLGFRGRNGPSGQALPMVLWRWSIKLRRFRH